jgi:dTDP-4-amino-4,6-dideoxygalactose transaminase
MLAPLEQRGLLRRPVVPPDCQHNGHLYYILVPSEIDRQRVLDELKRNGVNAVFHYVPLHSSPAGLRFGRSHGDLALTTSLSQRLIRIPMWFGLSEPEQQRVVDVLSAVLGR